MFHPGFLTGSAARSLTKTTADAESARRKLDLAQTPKDKFFPAIITQGSSSGNHSWEEQGWDRDGVREDMDPSTTGDTGMWGDWTWNPARMPDGSTLTDLPRECWVRAATTTQDVGTVFEIFVSPPGGGGEFGNGLPVVFHYADTTVTSPRQVEILDVVLGTLPGAGEYLVTGTFAMVHGGPGLTFASTQIEFLVPILPGGFGTGAIHYDLRPTVSQQANVTVSASCYVRINIPVPFVLSYRRTIGGNVPFTTSFNNTLTVLQIGS